VKPGVNCVCGQPLPWHLFELALDNFVHVCSCERRYVINSEKAVVQDGTEHNPVAAFDRAHPEFSPD